MHNDRLLFPAGDGTGKSEAGYKQHANALQAKQSKSRRRSTRRA